MTIEETRQLGIEFERRVQTMIPDREFLDKLDTETIYSFLNQYQDKYIHEIYRNLDKFESGSKLSSHIESVLQALYTGITLKVGDKSSMVENNTSVRDGNDVEIIDTARSIKWKLPTDFYMYVRSVSSVTKTYSFKSNETQKNKIRVLPNQMVSQWDVWRLIETPHDSLRILRYPIAVLDIPKNEEEGEERNEKTKTYPTITCIYDQHTEVEGIRVLYYKQPQHFDLMTSTACELPSDAFDDLVTGAVDLYVSYITNNRPTDRSRQPVIPASETTRAKEEAEQAQRSRRRQQDNDQS